MSDNDSSPSRLHRIAKDVIAAAEANPDPWFQEWAEWTTRMIGPRPKMELGTRAWDNWNLVALGALLSWGYFASAVETETDDSGEQSDDSGTGDSDGSGTSGEGGPGDRGSSGAVEVRAVTPPTFAVLGPDGAPLIEGYRKED